MSSTAVGDRAGSIVNVPRIAVPPSGIVTANELDAAALW
jgi:hypothetical protein